MFLQYGLLPLLGFCLGFLLQKQLGSSALLDTEKQWRTRLEQEIERRSAAEQAAKQTQQLQEALDKAQEQIRWLSSSCGQLEVRLKEEQRAVNERTSLLKETEERLSQSFKAMSADALQKNNQAFLDLAKANLEKFQESARNDLGKRQTAIDELVKPVRETLTKFESKLIDLDKVRSDSHASLKAQISSLCELQTTLARETTKIATALKATAVRGRWGEMQLRRIVELAGMVDHCDFFEQKSAEGEDGRLRPDMIVQLPEGRQVVIDAKVPLEAYLAACETTDEDQRTVLMKKHAEHVRSHIKLLSSKRYTDHFQPSPEFVVLFLPGEIFFSAALTADPTLIEMGAEKNVILATPTTLISLLRAVGFGWRQQSLSQNAQKISALGAELYKRLSVLGQHWSRVGKHLQGATHAYNDAVGSLERRVLVTAREFEKLDASPNRATIDVLSPLDSTTRPLQAPELVSEINS